MKEGCTLDTGILLTEEELQEVMAWKKNSEEDWLKEQSGVIPYGLHNSYMFRAVMQRKPRVLKELVRCLLALPESVPISCVIRNPLVLGSREEEGLHPLLLQVYAGSVWEGRMGIWFVRERADRKPKIMRIREEQEGAVRTWNHNLCRLAGSKEEKGLSLPGFFRLFQAESWKELKELGSTSPVFLEAARTVAELSLRQEVLEQCKKADRIMGENFQTSAEKTLTDEKE